PIVRPARTEPEGSDGAFMRTMLQTMGLADCPSTCGDLWRRTLALLCWMMILAAGCERPGRPPAQTPPTVTVSRPLRHEVIEWDDYTGHLASPDSVNVQAQ